MNRRVLISLLFLLAATLQLSAQKLVAKVSKAKLASGEKFVLSFELSGSGSNFKFPSLNDFDIYSGPNQSQSMSYINGMVTQSVSLSFILAPKKEGKFTIGPASVTVNGSTIQSNPVVIEVSKGAGGSAQQGAIASGGDNVADNLFVRTTVSKNKAYIGEQITIVHKVYTRYALRGFQDVKFPDYNGFWSQDYNDHKQIELTTENLDGVNYHVAEIRRSFLFPQRAGKLEIDPVTIDCIVRKQSSRRHHDPFEQIFGGGYEEVVYKIKGRPVIIDVQALPSEGKPENFSGAVGEYSYKVQLSRNEAKTNEGLTLTVSLTGKGNIKLVDPGKINLPEEFEQYDPKSTENIVTGSNGVSGTRTFEYMFIPRKSGDYTLRDLHFSYFDPQAAKYVTLPSPELQIHIEQGKDDPGSVTMRPAQKSDLKVLGEDIRHIRTGDPELKARDDYFYGTAAFYTALISPVLAFLLFAFVRKRQQAANSDPIAVRSRTATAIARKQLASAEKFIGANNKEGFYLEISRAVYQYIANKLNISSGEASREKIRGGLLAAGVSDTNISALLQLIETCEYARYAPGAVSGDLQSIHKQTVTLITSIENEIR